MIKSLRRKPSPLTARYSRWGVSLLEVILALAILGGSLAVLGEIVRTGTRSARESKIQVMAQLHCESVMAEILAGLRMPESMPPTSLDLQDSVNLEYSWMYTIESEPVEQDGLLVVRVTVYDATRANNRAAQYSMVRWMIDPMVEAELIEQANLILETMQPAEEEAAP